MSIMSLVGPHAHVEDNFMRSQLDMSDDEWLAQEGLCAIAERMAQQMLSENARQDREGILDKTIVDARAAACNAAYCYGTTGYYLGVLWNARLDYRV